MLFINDLKKKSQEVAHQAQSWIQSLGHSNTSSTLDKTDPMNTTENDTTTSSNEAAGHTISLPHTDLWSNGYPTTTYIDPESGLLTSATQGIEPVDPSTSIYDLFANRARRMPDDPLYTFQRNGLWIDKSALEFLADARSAAKGFIQYGLKKGDAVAFMCKTCYEWNVIDVAAMACGLVTATIYDTDSAEQIRNIVNNSDATVLVVQTQQMRQQAETVLSSCPQLKRIICLENGGLEELQAYNTTISDAVLDARIESVKTSDLCSIVYTSGSTSEPKGVEMTHGHYCNTALNIIAYMPDLLCHKEDNAALLFLPQAHSFARAINYILVSSCLRIYIASGITTLVTDLQVAKPTVMIVVPRVLEKIYNAASQKAGHGLKGKIFAYAAKVARQSMDEFEATGAVSAKTRAKVAAMHHVVYGKLHALLGGRAQWIVAGGAPLDPQLLAFFRGAGLPVYEGYGLTETTAPCAFNTPYMAYHRGSVGVAFPSFSVRIAEDGEIQVKGTSVFPRYHKNDAATVSSFTDDRWYATGDLGRLDNDGFLYITGRKKDLIITAGGKNVTPGPIEEVIRRCPLVSQAVVLGDKRPFIAALVTLDEEAVRAWLGNNGFNQEMSMHDAASNAAVRAEIQNYVDKANEGVSRAESVRKFVALGEEFSQENGLLTASMKIIRPKVLKRYAAVIANQIYSGAKR